MGMILWSPNRMDYVIVYEDYMDPSYQPKPTVSNHPYATITNLQTIETIIITNFIVIIINIVFIIKVIIITLLLGAKDCAFEVLREPLKILSFNAV